VGAGDALGVRLQQGVDVRLAELLARLCGSSKDAHADASHANRKELATNNVRGTRWPRSRQATPPTWSASEGFPNTSKAPNLSRFSSSSFLRPAVALVESGPFSRWPLPAVPPSPG
jgi:hypothetical protein